MAKRRRKKGALIAKAAGLYLLRKRIVDREKKKASGRIAAGKPALSAIAGPSIGRILYRSLGGTKLPGKAAIAASVQKKIRIPRSIMGIVLRWGIRLRHPDAGRQNHPLRQLSF